MCTNGLRWKRRRTSLTCLGLVGDVATAARLETMGETRWEVGDARDNFCAARVLMNNTCWERVVEGEHNGGSGVARSGPSSRLFTSLGSGDVRTLCSHSFPGATPEKAIRRCLSGWLERVGPPGGGSGVCAVRSRVMRLSILALPCTVRLCGGATAATWLIWRKKSKKKDAV